MFGIINFVSWDLILYLVVILFLPNISLKFKILTISLTLLFIIAAYFLIKYEYYNFIKNKSLEESVSVVCSYDNNKSFKFKNLKTAISSNGLNLKEIEEIAIEEIIKPFESQIENNISIRVKNIEDFNDYYEIPNYVTTLKCNKNFLFELKDIENLTELTYLDCSTNYIEDITPILKLKKLKYLDVSINAITSLKGLNRLKELKYLDCSANLITSLYKSLPNNLTSVKCNYNQIDSLDGIEQCQKLETLYFFSNRILSLKNLNNLNNLKTLNCSGNFIKSLDGLNNLIELEFLDCGFNRITSLNPIRNLLNLHEILCDNNIISTSPTFLNDFNDLININIDSNPVRNNDEIVLLLYRINNRQSSTVKIYNDNQNVHNSAIVNAIKSSIKNIMKEPLIQRKISSLI